VDIDGDGYLDILSGSYSRTEGSMAGLFHGLRGRPDRTFKKAAPLNGSDGKPLVIPVKDDKETNDLIKRICTRPFAVDWDGDGHLDLIVGNFGGTFYLFKGKRKGSFLPNPEEMKAGDQPLKIEGYHSDPFVVDWDGDGDLDLLSGSSEGGVQWAENRAGPGKLPQLTSFQTIIKHGQPVQHGQLLRDEDLKGPLGDTRVWVDDVNSDGKLDILVGDRVTLRSPADHVAEKDFKQKFDDWNKSLSEAITQMNATANDATKRNEAQQRYQELYQKRSEFMNEDMTGFVWLYLQK
jgi:FG-GAP-like repeat